MRAKIEAVFFAVLIFIALPGLMVYACVESNRDDFISRAPSEVYPKLPKSELVTTLDGCNIYRIRDEGTHYVSVCPPAKHTW